MLKIFVPPLWSPDNEVVTGARAEFALCQSGFRIRTPLWCSVRCFDYHVTACRVTITCCTASGIRREVDHFAATSATPQPGSLGARPRYKTHGSLTNSEYLPTIAPKTCSLDRWLAPSALYRRRDNLLAPALFPLPDPMPPRSRRSYNEASQPRISTILKARETLYPCYVLD